MRSWKKLDVDSSSFYLKLLKWGHSLKHFSVLHSGDPSKYTYPDEPSFKWMVAGEAVSVFQWEQDSSLDAMQSFLDSSQDWVFGGLSYDLKNEIENLESKLPDSIGFPSAFFFVPKYIVRADFFGNVEVAFSSSFSFSEQENWLRNIQDGEELEREVIPQVSLKPKITKSSYLKALDDLKRHIKRGDIYEINFCQELNAFDVDLDELQIWLRLTQTAAAPFGAFMKWEKTSLICGSPERYLKRKGNELVSQPIKGTTKRGKTTSQDAKAKTALQTDLKEQSENVMIVDLVRNDLARVAKKNSVEVNELFGVYSFPTVHQLISTVSCEIDSQTKLRDILKASFPMGSMTGAPKVSAMQLAEKYESTKRGLYSGSVGYIEPDGDFDFNVVIRALQYNSDKKVLSAIFGGAITDLSNPEKEYEECMLKAEAIQQSLKL